MKNKYKHGKAIAATTMALAAVSLVTVGFSAWVISTTTTQTTGNVSVSVGAVTDKTVPITLLDTDGVVDTNSTVKFDAVEDTGGNITAVASEEDMTFGITFKVDITHDFQGISVAATEANTGTYLTTWAGKNYIDLPFKLEKTNNGPSAETYIPLIDSTWIETKKHYIEYNPAFNNATHRDTDDPVGAYDVLVDVTAADKIITYVCTFNFHWGTYFAGKNPVLEANKEISTSNISNALGEMQQSTAFKLTVKHDPKTTVTVSH